MNKKISLQVRYSAFNGEVDIDGSEEVDQTVLRGKGGGRGQILLGEGEVGGEGRRYEGGAAVVSVSVTVHTTLKGKNI